jgi:hypothetical protein
MMNYPLWNLQRSVQLAKQHEKHVLVIGHHRKPLRLNTYFTLREVIIDVDVIPSPQVEPMSATLVEEEEHALTMDGIDIDSCDSAWG